MNISKGHIPLHPQAGLAFPYKRWRRNCLAWAASCHHQHCLSLSRTQPPVPSAPSAMPQAGSPQGWTHSWPPQECKVLPWVSWSSGMKHTYFREYFHTEENGTPQHSTCSLSNNCKESNHKQPWAQFQKNPTFYGAEDTLTALQKRQSLIQELSKATEPPCSLQMPICWPWLGVLVSFQKETKATMHLSPPTRHTTFPMHQVGLV